MSSLSIESFHFINYKSSVLLILSVLIFFLAVADDLKVTHQTFMILLVTVSIGLLFAFTALCLLLCKKLLINIVTYVILRNIEGVIFF